ncbi:hypothetical protein CFD26_107582 [Aspergillus turcosus]|uniref:Bud22 domain-containing protein n=1 Tax=Aspergillus turcosus TaxID=1245748 RepID=A0A3R7HWU5_9EURO|nr:hypothetical protein CFD26_107582 [Aspergillus turcosus]
MPKRKFSDLNDRASASGPSDIKLARLTAKFENGVTALSRALKTARAFERQKLGRREKTAKSENKPEALARIEEEIKVIKTLNYQSTAEKYLFKQLVKTKRIAESPVFLKFKERKNISTEGPRSTAEANVTARLYKSNPVKNVFPGIMDGIRQLLGLEGAPAGKKSGPEQEQKKGSTDQRKSESKEKEPESALDGRSGPESGSEADSRTTSKSATRSVKLASEEAEEEGSDVDMDDAESVDYSHFDARLAPGSGSDSDGESDAEEASDSDISRSPSPDQPTKKSKKSTSTPATSTTFLPSLTMGGYFSGSESEPEDLEGVAGPPRRKNRMGQQARRALWEKKYGSGANHIKKQKENEWKNRDSGWDTRRGATDGSEGPRGKRGLGQGRADRPRQRDDKFTNNQPHRGPSGGSDKKNVKDDKPLHPSWEAARKAKEQKSMAAFQGKKVTFD